MHIRREHRPGWMNLEGRMGFGAVFWCLKYGIDCLDGGAATKGQNFKLRKVTTATSGGPGLMKLWKTMHRVKDCWLAPGGSPGHFWDMFTCSGLRRSLVVLSSGDANRNINEVFPVFQQLSAAFGNLSRQAKPHRRLSSHKNWFFRYTCTKAHPEMNNVMTNMQCWNVITGY